MADFLKLNGIRVPVLDGSAKTESEVIGEVERVDDASLSINRRAIKGSWEFSIAHQVAATALAFRDLLLGRGHYWSFDSHLYSSKGVPMVPHTVVSVESTQKKFGAKSMYVEDGSYGEAATLLSGVTQWTVAAWVYGHDVVSQWAHYVVRSDGAKWKDGVRNDAQNTTFCSTSSSYLRIVGGNGSDPNVYCDDLVFLPFLVPTDWPAQMYAFNAAFSPLAKLCAAGELIEANSRTVLCGGEYEGADLMQGTVNGAWYQNLHVVHGRLREV